METSSHRILTTHTGSLPRPASLTDRHDEAQVAAAVAETVRRQRAAGVDVDQVVRDPAHPARLLARLAAPDHLHANDAGYAAVAEAMPLDFCAH